MLKKAVFTACIAGIISSLLKNAAVTESSKRVIRLLTGIMLIIAFVKPLTSIGDNDLLYSFDVLEEDSRYESTINDFTELYLRTAEMEAEKEVAEAFEERGISCENVVITCETDEYNVVTISKAEITVSEDCAAKAAALASELLPETEVYIMSAEDPNEYRGS